MSDYKSTLNLPATDFPMKANLANREGGFLSDWEKSDLYQQIRDKFKGKPKFVLFINIGCLLFRIACYHEQIMSLLGALALIKPHLCVKPLLL